MFEKIIHDYLTIPWVLSLTILIGSLIAAYLASQIICRGVMVAAGKTQTDLDDRIVLILHRPIFISVMLAGIAWAVAVIATQPPDGGWFLKPGARQLTYAVLRTVAVLIWGLAGMRIGRIVLSSLSARSARSGTGVVQPRTLPALDILLKLVVIASATYFALLSWNVNVSGWLASAGILGLVIGLAAKDTLANLFAGIFILADAPYKIGDFIMLDDNLRGRVTDIGIRSTRVLTRNDILVTIPNAVIGNSKIVNETAGPHDKERVKVRVSVAYGSDLKQVRKVLLGCPEGVLDVSTEPQPRVRFREFGDSGLVLDLLVWVEEPVMRGRVIDRLNQRVYDAFNEAGIEIPYNKHDVYIKEHRIDHLPR